MYYRKYILTTTLGGEEGHITLHRSRVKYLTGDFEAKRPKLFTEASSLIPCFPLTPVPGARRFLLYLELHPFAFCVYLLTFARHTQIDDEGRLQEASVASVIGEAFHSADGYIGRCLSRWRGPLAQFHAFDNMAEADDDRERKIRGVRRDGSDGGG